MSLVRGSYDWGEKEKVCLFSFDYIPAEMELISGISYSEIFHGTRKTAE